MFKEITIILSVVLTISAIFNLILIRYLKKYRKEEDSSNTNLINKWLDIPTIILIFVILLAIFKVSFSIIITLCAVGLLFDIINIIRKK